MVPTDSRRPLAAAAVALLLVLTSTSAAVAVATPDEVSAHDNSTPATADETDERAVVSEFRSTLDSLDSVQFRMVTETTTDNETTKTVTDIAADFEESRLRRDVVESEYSEGVVTVVNETTRVTYNPEENTLRRSDTYTDARLPMLTMLANESAVSYDVAGTTTLNGDPVYELIGEPTETENTDTNATLTVLVDADTYFPAQVTVASDSDYGSYTWTTTYENVTLNAEIPDSQFEIDVPENATTPTVNDGPEITEHESFDGFQSAATVRVPQPEMPTDYEFDGGHIIDGDSYYSASATYTNGSDTITMNVNADESLLDFSEIDGYEDVSIGNATGWYRSYEDARYNALHWDCNGQSYTLFGDLSKADATSIAASAACE